MQILFKRQDLFLAAQIYGAFGDVQTKHDENFHQRACSGVSSPIQRLASRDAEAKHQPHSPYDRYNHEPAIMPELWLYSFLAGGRQLAVCTLHRGNRGCGGELTAATEAFRYEKGIALLTARFKTSQDRQEWFAVKQLQGPPLANVTGTRLVVLGSGDTENQLPRSRRIEDAAKRS